MKHNVYINLFQKAIQTQENVEVQQTFNLESCLCFSQNLLGIKVGLLQDAFYPGQVITVFIEIDNVASTLELQMVDVVLECLVFLGRGVNMGLLGTDFRRINVVMARFPIRIQPGQRIVGDQRIRIDLDTSLSQQSVNCYSTKGRIVQCTYDVKVTLTTNASSNAALACKCVMMPNFSMNPGPQIVTPPNWHCYTYPQANLLFDPMQ